MEALRTEHYNATISYLDEVHEDLWIFRVRPDDGPLAYQAGQYTTLALGFWEPRIDELTEDLDDAQRRKLARRSYSVSSSMLAENGSLLDPAEEAAAEFYVVLVRSDSQGTPAVLTPRLFLKGEGDRLFIGRKAAGRYRLDRFDDPTADVVFLSTGTGEAPNNRMTLDLLRRGHQGRIVGVCTTRYLRDLAYLETHGRLAERYDNYEYIPLTTREPENEGNKIYIQDLIESAKLEEMGFALDPERTHVYLCGNPLMIGLPEWDGDTPTYPETRGVVEILTERGFTLDHGRTIGNIHIEEYW
ncbi:MAG: ferredoxin--NADP reductase [Acidobacteria bacterium]|nr:ferredoxin--NADP reductase [Acidobacteriota bacterium]